MPFCGTVGLRFTEAVTLTDDRVDLDAGTIFIPARINKSRRPKPIPLARIELQLLREQLLARPPGTHVVFATEKGGTYSHSGFQSIWLPALLAAGLAHEVTNERERTVVVADFRFHWLRHTAISLMARAGTKAELIAERVGHNDGGALIYRRYRHLFPSEVREAVTMLDNMLDKTAENAETGGPASGQKVDTSHRQPSQTSMVKRRKRMGGTGLEPVTPSLSREDSNHFESSLRPHG